MDPRHAFTLALVAWYLMATPSTPGGLTNPRTTLIKGSAPISEWVIRRGFDSAEECDEAKVAGMNKAKPIVQDDEAWKERRIRDPYSALNLVQLLVSQCIATDDPRLKEK